MKRVSVLITLSILTAFNQTGFAQQCGGRYESEVFSNFTMTTVVYSDTFKARPDSTTFLKMNVYEPSGDNFAQRPVVIMAHGGTFVAGDRTESTCAALCEAFAKRGYVAASIDYRLAGSQAELFDSINALRIALRTVGDMKAAVRYFRKDAATVNQFRADGTQIWVGGNSAGAITALHVAYVTDTAELPSYIKPVVAQMGGIDGNSGNAGYPSNVSGVINLAGGINKREWIAAGDIPLVSCHGNADQTVPYNCNDVLYPDNALFDLVDVCGSGAIKDWCDANGTEDSLLTFPGDGHVPWQNSSAKFTQMENYVTDFVAKHTICDSTTVGIRDVVAAKNLFSVYPNPATDNVTIKLVNRNGNEKVQVEIFDSAGKSVLNKNYSSTEDIQVNLKDLQKGVYMLRVKVGEQASSTVINKL